MNATQRLIEATGLLLDAMRRYQMDVDDSPSLDHRRVMGYAEAALAAAKEEQGKVLTDEEIERIRDENTDGLYSDALAAFLDGLRYARDNNYLAPAKGSGLTVEGVIRTLKDTLKWGEYTGSMVLDWLLEDEPSMDGQDIEESLRKALEDLAGKE